jgi:peroxiredoxin
MFADVFVLLILLSVWLGFYLILKQQGRMILRLDALEQRTSIPDSSQPRGLEVGAAFPSFTLPDLHGNSVSLEHVRGKRVLLVHWNPECGFCDLIAPDIARIEAELDQHRVQLLLLAYGNAEANRKLAQEHSLRCPILLYGDAKIPEPFANLGTPSAYLLDSEARVARSVAIGSEEVPALAQEAVKVSGTAEQQIVAENESKRLPGQKPLSASQIIRHGLKAGTRAPAFTLPDIYGKTVSLDNYRGRRVLLVFSDPHCGPCDDLAPQLARLHRQHRDNLALILIGRGEPDENRKKAEGHAIEFPVLIQEKWRLSREYGIFSTPVAFLVNEDGVIAKDVAIGPEAILILARQGLENQKESEYELSYR